MSRSQPQPSIIPSVSPPPLFALVEPGVYRCAYPGPHHVAHLVHTIGARTVILLSIEQLPHPVVSLFKAAEPPVMVAHVTQGVWAAQAEVCTGLVEDAFHYIFDAACYPLVLMCPTGALQTSAVVGCLRRVLRWSYSSIVAECASFTAVASPLLHGEVCAFIERFEPPTDAFGPSASLASAAQRRLRSRVIHGAPGAHTVGAPSAATPPSASSQAVTPPTIPGGGRAAGGASAASGASTSWPHSPDLPPAVALSAAPSDVVTPDWWRRYRVMEEEERALWVEQCVVAGRPPATRSHEVVIPTAADVAASVAAALRASPQTSVVDASASAALYDVKELREAAERKALKQRIKAMRAHDIYRFVANPPAVGPSVKFNRTDSIVEEDDD